MTVSQSVLPITHLHDDMGLLPRTNRLLAALPAHDLAAWLPALRPLRLQRGHVLPADQALFPTTAIVSLFASTRVGQTTEVTTVGNEGFVGVPLLVGTDHSGTHAEVTGSGHAFAMAGTTLRAGFMRSAGSMELLLRYMNMHTAQAMQRAVCVDHHSLEQRFCRCLLDSLDRGRWRTRVELTHESIATRLGARRESITLCAQRLQNDGVIAYQRGVIDVLDLEALRAGSCPCYDEVRKLCDRLLPAIGPSQYTPWSPLPGEPAAFGRIGHDTHSMVANV